MRENGLSALALYGTVGSYNEVQYLSNFLVTREAMLVFPLDGEPTLLVQMFNHVPNARQVACIQDVRWGGLDTAITAAENLQARGLAESRIGLVGMLPVLRYAAMQRTLPNAPLVDFTQPMSHLRQIERNPEIDFLRRGAEFGDQAVEPLQHEARPG